MFPRIRSEDEHAAPVPRHETSYERHTALQLRLDGYSDAQIAKLLARGIRIEQDDRRPRAA